MGQIILDQYDNEPWGHLRPEFLVEPISEFPEIMVCEFSATMVQEIVKKYKAEKIGRLISVGGDTTIYELSFNTVRIGICQVMIGAPACVNNLEDMIALGAKKVLVCGECGALSNSIDDAQLIIPTSAVRDEGTSYHYQPASDEIKLDTYGIKVIETVFKDKRLPYKKGKIWTTDAPYRETKNKIHKRKAQGCIAVDMECSALVAAAKLRNITFAQFVYACDNLDADVWEQRGLIVRSISQKMQFFELAMECAIKL